MNKTKLDKNRNYTPEEQARRRALLQKLLKYRDEGPVVPHKDILRFRDEGRR